MNGKQVKRKASADTRNIYENLSKTKINKLAYFLFLLHMICIGYQRCSKHASPVCAYKIALNSFITVQQIRSKLMSIRGRGRECERERREEKTHKKWLKAGICSGAQCSTRTQINFNIHHIDLLALKCVHLFKMCAFFLDSFTIKN